MANNMASSLSHRGPSFLVFTHFIYLHFLIVFHFSSFSTGLLTELCQSEGYSESVRLLPVVVESLQALPKTW